MQASLDALDDLVVLINKRLPEKERRILLGAAAKVYGHGGEKRVKDLTGIAFSTLHRGKADADGELAKPVAQEVNNTPVLNPNPLIVNGVLLHSLSIGERNPSCA